MEVNSDLEFEKKPQRIIKFKKLTQIINIGNTGKQHIFVNEPPDIPQ